MNYLYSGLWFVVAVLLFVRFRKEGKVIYLLSGYFVFMGVWWLADAIMAVDLMSGVYGWILRGVSFVVILILLLMYFRSKNKKSTDETLTVSQENSEK